MEEIITFDFIWNCWKGNTYPENFDSLLERYLNTKREVFSNSRMPDEVTSWLSKILISIEIGIVHDKERFLWYKEYWENILGRKWVASIEDRWVEWKID